jgi:hypothetical protein
MRDVVGRAGAVARANGEKAMKKLLMAGVAAAGLTLASPAAQAATIGQTASNNDVIGQVTGWFGAQWYLIAGATTTIDVFFIGVEAGFNNSFTIGGSPFGPYGGGANTGLSTLFGGTTAPTSLGTASINPGLINFFFTTPNGVVTNGSNPPQGSSPEFWSAVYTCDTSNANLAASCAWGTGSTASFGNTLILALDDGGGGRDDNHDDLVMVIRISNGSFTQVPEPATLGLLGAGLLGLGFAARRRRKA